MITRVELRNKVPHGYSKVIAERAGVSQRYVSKFLTNDKIKSVRVEMAALEVLAELQRKRDELVSAILN